ncbi:MAG TPA: PQQ-binding-like beta-propeller repeat protein [Flavobacteriales bacterium]|nr:PQQ-binding-like beta-propeller repeat protein [Flavobacteriales bacterium]
MKKTFLYIFLLFALKVNAQDASYTKVDTVWSIHTKGYVTMMPYVDDEITVVGCDQGNLYCVNSHTGEKLWEYKSAVDEGPAKNGIFHTIVSDKNYLYMNNSGTVVLAIDRKTGQEVWRYYEARFDDDIFTRIVQTEKTIILNTLVPSVLCIDKQSGKKVWEYNEFTRKAGPAAIVSDNKDNIYFTSPDSVLHCINATTGAKNWEIKTGSSTSPFGPCLLEDRILVNRHRNKRDTISSIECYSLKTQKLLWKKTEKPSLIFGHGKQFYSFSDGIRCWDVNGKEVWRIEGNFRWYTAPLFKDGKIYYHNRFGATIWVIDEATGHIVKLYPVDGKTYTTPVVTDKYIYFAQGHNYRCMRK